MNALRIGLALLAAALATGCDTNPGGPSAPAAGGAAATPAPPAETGGPAEGGARRQMGGRPARPKTGSQPATAD